MMTIAAMTAVAVAGLFAGIASLALNQHQRLARRRSVEQLRDELNKNHLECLRQIASVTGHLEAAEQKARSNTAFLDGRLAMPVRARALRMLRSGMAAETTAAELGLAASEVRLLEKVSVLLAPQNQ